MSLWSVVKKFFGLQKNAEIAVEQRNVLIEETKAFVQPTTSIDVPAAVPKKPREEIMTIETNQKFEQCVSFVLDREGRTYENNPLDPGGETKFGISHKSYPNISIKDLTEEQAKDIYFKEYWTPLNCDQYEDRLALAIFDTGVNQGVGTAKAILVEFSNQELNAEKYLFRRLRRYFNLCQKNPKLLVWLDDWLLRVIKVSEFVFK